MKIISFFNHKGGVSKTTTVYHLGWKLAQLGKRVLMVDTDSQCNLTLMSIGEDNIEDFIAKNPNNNIKSSLDVAFNSKPELIPIPQCVKVKGLENLLLMPGSFEITEFEVQLGIACQLTNSFSTMNALPGSFSYLFEKTAEEFGIDIVLIDLNPSLSSINQVLLSSSDYFILPTSPDYFSQMAISSMSRILPRWERWAVQAREVFGNSSYKMHDCVPKFLGYTVNDYSIRNQKPTAAFSSIISKTASMIDTELYPELQKVDMTIDRANYSNGSLLLASVSNYQGLMPLYQQYGIPVFALSDEQLGTTGVILEGQKDKRRIFDNIYTDCANEILRLISL